MAVDIELTSLTDAQLDEKIQKLSKIVFSSNLNLARQAKYILMTLYEEQSSRNDKKFEEYLKKHGAKTEDIINIG